MTRSTTSATLLAVFTLAMVSQAHGKIVTKAIEYQHGDTILQGFLAYDDEIEGKRPGVLIVHEWWGLGDYVKGRAVQLAEMGYVAFALDMYGKDKLTDDPKQAGAWAGQFYQNPALARERLKIGLQMLRDQPQVDAERLAAIGYCFGGSMVIQLAYSGADIDGVVSFHGNPVPPAEADYDQIHASILVCHGASDAHVGPEKIQAFEDGVTAAGADWQLVSYGHAVHSFTNPEADQRGMPSVGYNKEADERSWAHMKLFLDEIFAE